MAKVLANGHRLEILVLLAQGERCVEDLAERGARAFSHDSRVHAPKFSIDENGKLVVEPVR
jgi:DNA-binding transcriptional ArsR family regulator